MMVGASKSPGEEEVAETLFSAGERQVKSPVLDRDRPWPLQGQAKLGLAYRETPL